eukprot:6179905-Pleurochrysis_carterae.AAC.3
MAQSYACAVAAFTSPIPMIVARWACRRTRRKPYHLHHSTTISNLGTIAVVSYKSFKVLSLVATKSCWSFGASSLLRLSTVCDDAKSLASLLYWLTALRHTWCDK